MAKRSWVRLWADLLDCRKIQTLEPELFRAWVNFLLLSRDRDGLLPSDADLAFGCRSSIQQASAYREALTVAGLIDRTDTGHHIHDWDHWQPARDHVSTERTRRYRQQRDGNTAASETQPVERVPCVFPEHDERVPSVLQSNVPVLSALLCSSLSSKPPKNGNGLEPNKGYYMVNKEDWHNRPLPYPQRWEDGTWWFRWNGPEAFTRGPYADEPSAVSALRAFIDNYARTGTFSVVVDDFDPKASWDEFLATYPDAGDAERGCRAYLSIIASAADPAAEHAKLMDGLARWMKSAKWLETDGRQIELKWVPSMEKFLVDRKYLGRPAPWKPRLPPKGKVELAFDQLEADEKAEEERNKTRGDNT